MVGITEVDEYTGSTMRRARLALDQIVTIDGQTLTPARESMRAERVQQLAEFEPVLSGYAQRLRDGIAARQELPADHPEARSVLEELPELRDRLAIVDRLLVEIRAKV